MKKVFSIIVGVLLTASVFAQAPQKMSYQAVIRNSSNALVTNQQVGMQISILQGSANGTSVYVETQTPTTNDNGLVSIEIGVGTVLSGNFSTIDWVNGPYFLKTETDPSGGTNYTITGTSQLLSVPYAMHAKTAETVTGGITETDPIFTSSPAGSITTSDISNWNNKLDVEVDSSVTNEIQALSISNDTIYLSNGGFVKLPAVFDGHYSSLIGAPTNVSAFTNDAGYLTSEVDGSVTNEIQTLSLSGNDLTISGTGGNTVTLPAADGSETKVIAGTNVTVTGAGTTASPYVVNATGATTLTIGQSYQGGIIFWLDATGQHGLIAATADQSTGIHWYNGTSRYTGATGDGLYAGSMNTAIIVATQMADNQTGNFAAKVCADYSVTVDGVTYGDWYLPSKYELNLLYNQRVAVGGFASDYYWSSTDGDNDSAWQQDFVSGYQDGIVKAYPNYVRAIRAF